jgi:ATP-dependent RNA helicase DHX29
VKLEKRYSSETATTLNNLDERLIPYDLIIRLLEMICFEDGTYAAFSPAILIFTPGLGEIRRLNDLLTEHRLFGSDQFKIYPLHSTLSSESQGAVFDIPPPGIRKIVIGDYLFLSVSSPVLTIYLHTSYKYCGNWYYYS